MMDILDNVELAVVVFVLAALADVLSTLGALARGGREANPILAKLMDGKPQIIWMLFRLGAAFAVAWFAVRYGYAWTLWIGSLLTLGVAWHNSRVMR